jgi:hypothetical protein
MKKKAVAKKNPHLHTMTVLTQPQAVAVAKAANSTFLKVAAELGVNIILFE